MTMKRGAAGKLIRRSKDLRPSEKLIMLTLLDPANNMDCGIPYSPSLTRIQRETKYSRATVIDGLAHLELHGWLTRENRQPGQLPGTKLEGRDKGRVIYRLLPGEITPCTCPRARSARRLPGRSTSHSETGQMLTHLDRSTEMPVSAGQDADDSKGLSVTRELGSGGLEQQLTYSAADWLTSKLPKYPDSWTRWPPDSIGEEVFDRAIKVLGDAGMLPDELAAA